MEELLNMENLVRFWKTQHQCFLNYPILSNLDITCRRHSSYCEVANFALICINVEIAVDAPVRAPAISNNPIQPCIFIAPTDNFDWMPADLFSSFVFIYSTFIWHKILINNKSWLYRSMLNNFLHNCLRVFIMIIICCFIKHSIFILTCTLFSWTASLNSLSRCIRIASICRKSSSHSKWPS